MEWHLTCYEASYSTINTWNQIENQDKKSSTFLQKHLPKLHLTHKSLKLGLANRTRTIS